MCDAAEADRVLDTLAKGPLSMDDLSARTGYALHRLNRVLCALLLAGRTTPVKVRAGGRNKTHYALKVKVS